eukprot:TRINITY_DN81709_c0_g1_i1.p1 TRINITY_DN81709_c0_g1~~TRINITY_DN81709_c0_g1_i1.p1  ORF type:complete len:613 (+),score=94.17 TRINITY_DN81709_c0_g1_i1:217-2055(+)
MCYCADYNGCATDGMFTALLGVLTILGPSPQDQGRTCAAGQPCVLGPFLGQGLSDQDRVVFISASGTCGTIAAELGPKAVSSALTVSLTAIDLPAGVRWKICYCTGAGSAGCTATASFGARLGMLTVLGPSPNNQDLTCFAGGVCRLGGNGFTGQGLSANDRVQLVENSLGVACGAARASQAAGAGHGEQKAVLLASSAKVARYSAETWRHPSLALGGVWKMCYCTANLGGCNSNTHFSVQAGTLTVRGPDSSTQDVTCSALAACNLPATGRFTGQGLTATDRIVFLRKGDSCGFSARDSAAFQNMAKSMNSGQVSLVAADLPFGGQWLMCFCSGVSSGCSSDADFTGTLGILSVIGAAPTTQSQICAQGIACTLGEYTGFQLSAADYVGIIQCTPGSGDNVASCCSSYNWGSFPGGNRLKQIQIADSQPTVQLSASEVPPGGTWAVCHCLRGSCGSVSSSIVALGLLTVIGPDASQTIACVFGKSCSSPALSGHQLVEGDLVALLGVGQCGSALPGVDVGAGTAKRVSSSLRFDISAFDLPFGGSWVACYCSLRLQGCESAQDYGSQVVSLQVYGVGSGTQGSTFTCTAGVSCQLGPFGGQGLTSETRFSS